MVSVGRTFCVSLPVLLTIGAIVTLLIPMLAGAAHNNMSLFQINLKNATIKTSQLAQLGDITGVHFRRDDTVITASRFGLADTYDITLWGYCKTTNGKRECTKPQFDWASKTLNDTLIDNFGAPVGIQGVSLPKDVAGAIRSFRIVWKFTEIAFIMAAVALGLELIIGIFAVFSRAVSCLVWLEAIVATFLVIAASSMATATAGIVAGAIKGTAGSFHVTATIWTNFLVSIWLSAAFSIAAVVFWVSTICCCKPESRTKYRDSHHEGEKLIQPRAYQPLNNDHEMTGFYNHNQNQSRGSAFQNPHEQYPPRYAANNGRANLGYEPYSHRA